MTDHMTPDDAVARLTPLVERYGSPVMREALATLNAYADSRDHLVALQAEALEAADALADAARNDPENSGDEEAAYRTIRTHLESLEG